MEEPKIILEEADFVVLNKPAGMLVHATTAFRKDEHTLTAWLMARYPEIVGVGDVPDVRPGIVHRLDKDTSGCIVIARNNVAFYELKKMFQSRAIEKKYLALVWGIPKEEEGVIIKPIGLNPGTTKHTTFIRRAKMVKDAETHYRVLRRLVLGSEPLSLVEVIPKTGRTHQIRVHLNDLHHPILGDVLYGGKTKQHLAESLNIPRLMLHSASLTFTMPGKKTIRAEAVLPSDFEVVLARVESAPLDSHLRN
ncbi:MAG: RluA family pseudouridine synthase [Patescibacteria group bacterium]